MTHAVRYIDELKACSKVYLACSGGIDSMVLLHILKSNNISIHVLHANFRLRGTDSTKDASFVAAYCEKQKIPFTIQVLDVTKKKKNEQQSIQQLARDMRYKWFEECLDASPKSVLCTAHHADDSIEQMWIRMLSSGTLLTCQGIPAKRERIRRPMIDWSKSEMQKYALHHGISWREDASNVESKYTRNAIRLDLIPMMEKIDPRAKAASQRLMSEVARLHNECLIQIIKALGAEIREHHFFVDQQIWENALTVWKEVLLGYWKNSALGLSELDKLMQKGALGKFISFDDFYVLKEREGLWFGRHSLDEMTLIQVPKSLFKDAASKQKESSKHIDLSDKQTLMIRKIQSDDKLFLAHQNKYRSIKKIFNDQKWLHHRRKSAIGFFADGTLLTVFSLHDEKKLFGFQCNDDFFSKNLLEFVISK
jgi:tRNA(Ile)-lysidine synthetase-like protein